MMVDFLTVSIPCNLPQSITGGTITRTSEEGEIKWSVTSRLDLDGSWSSKCTVRAVLPTMLEISGNLGKFLCGHNLYGDACPRSLVRRFLDRIQPLLWPQGMPDIDIDEGIISRIDCTSGYIFKHAGDVLAWLRAAHERGVRPYVGRGVFKGTDDSTLVYGDATGKRAKAWQVMFYYKGREIVVHRLPAPMEERPDVIEWCSRLLRAEVRIRTPELNRMEARRLGDWDAAKVAETWREKIGKIDMIEQTVTENANLTGMKPRLLDAFQAYKAGADLRENRSRPSWFRLRKDMRATFGVDISAPPPVSNVVPLRRVIVADPVGRPEWADDVDAVLETEWQRAVDQRERVRLFGNAWAAA